MKKINLLCLLLPLIGFCQKPVPDKLVVLSFDDASASHYRFVAPLLKKCNFGATFYVCEFPPDFADTSKYMNWRQIQQLSQMGFEIGNHTWHHRHVTGQSPEQLDSELNYIENKCEELRIPKPVTFAYPGYVTDPAAVPTLQKHHYRIARTGGDRPFDPNFDDPMYVPSFTITGDDISYFHNALEQAKNGKVIIFTVHGVPDNAHDWVNTPQAVFKKYLQYLHDHHFTVIAMKDLASYFPRTFDKASWISPGFKEDSVHALPVFRKLFNSKNIRSAHLSITARGLYEARINGRRVGAAYLTPGWTNYNKRLQYQTYDVTKLLRASNEIKVTVADGWYRGVFGGDLERDRYGSKAGLIFQLEITHNDGSKEWIVSDSSWQVGTGPILYSNLYHGEIFNANITTANWSKVFTSVDQYSHFVLSIAEPVAKCEIFPAKELIKNNIIDFGQNLAGFVRFSVKGKRGDTIRIYHAESLDKDGNFYTGNLREAKAEDIYILKGNGVEIFEPIFTYHGFRYIKVEGCIPNLKDFTAIALHSNLKVTGSFECSNPLINQLQNNITWSLNSNFVDIPTDCPQRSERLGWTGDAQVFARTAAFNCDVKLFFTKWLADLKDDQGNNGGVPVIIPDIYRPEPMAKRGVAGWGDAATIIPWTLYEVYGDTSILRNQYPSMQTWLSYIQCNSSGDLWRANGYGDWYAPGDSTSLPYIDQCFYAYSTQLVLNAARILNKDEDVKFYSDQLSKIKLAFLKAYIDSDGRAITHTQTAYTLALKFDLIPESLKQKAIHHLVDLIHKNNDHLATGFLGTPYLLYVLSENGYRDLAYILLNQATPPSWLYPITKGATTIWEKWEAIRPDGSFDTCSLNHYAYGAVGAWLYQTVAGIRSLEPGYKKVLIAPKPGGGLTWVKASYESPYGKIVSVWKIEKGYFILTVLVPRSALIELPDNTKRKVGPGRYNYKVKYERHD